MEIYNYHVFLESSLAKYNIVNVSNGVSPNPYQKNLPFGVFRACVNNAKKQPVSFTQATL